MNVGPGVLGLAYLAGVLSTLSPCVLPLLPILLASAVSQHRFGALALAAGLTLSFTVVGLFVATLGASIGLDGPALRKFAALLLVIFGAVLCVPALQLRFAAAAGRISSSGDRWLGGLAGTGWQGQLAVGGMLGLVWSPCVGPTLGAAATLASQGRDLAHIAMLMLVFGLGAGTPLLVVGSLSREAMARARGRLLVAGERGRGLLGLLLLLLGLAILSGVDKQFESWVVIHSPDWLTELTTRF